MERNILLTMAYDGSRYHGYQVQENAITICEVFQNAVEKLLGVRYDVKGCSRTDTGVHAKDYKLSMKINHSIPCKGLVIGLNQKLPVDIVVMNAMDVPSDFHARYHAIGKEYTYYIHNSSFKDPFQPTQVYQHPWDIDEELLDREAQVLVGTHDFSAFSAKAHLVENPVRTITGISVKRLGETVIIKITGDGFLHNMVRIIVGTLLEISAGRMLSGELELVLLGKDRNKAGKTAPPQGLYLTKVEYPPWEGIHEAADRY